MINIGKLKCYHIEFFQTKFMIIIYPSIGILFLLMFSERSSEHILLDLIIYIWSFYISINFFLILFCKCLLAAYGNMIDILLSIVASAALLNLSTLFIEWWLLQIMTTLQIVSIFQLMNFYFIFKNFARALSSSLMFKMISVHLSKQSYWSYFAVYSTYHLFYKFDWFLKHQPNLHAYMSLGCYMVRYLIYH